LFKVEIVNKSLIQIKNQSEFVERRERRKEGREDLREREVVFK
jgi:hypothetical protein